MSLVKHAAATTAASASSASADSQSRSNATKRDALAFMGAVKRTTTKVPNRTRNNNASVAVTAYIKTAGFRSCDTKKGGKIEHYYGNAMILQIDADANSAIILDRFPMPTDVDPNPSAAFPGQRSGAVRRCVPVMHFKTKVGNDTKFEEHMPKVPERFWRGWVPKEGEDYADTHGYTPHLFEVGGYLNYSATKGKTLSGAPRPGTVFTFLIRSVLDVQKALLNDKYALSIDCNTGETHGTCGSIELFMRLLESSRSPDRSLVSQPWYHFTQPAGETDYQPSGPILVTGSDKVLQIVNTEDPQTMGGEDAEGADNASTLFDGPADTLMFVYDPGFYGSTAFTGPASITFNTTGDKPKPLELCFNTWFRRMQEFRKVTGMCSQVPAEALCRSLTNVTIWRAKAGPNGVVTEEDPVIIPGLDFVTAAKFLTSRQTEAAKYMCGFFLLKYNMTKMQEQVVSPTEVENQAYNGVALMPGEDQGKATANAYDVLINISAYFIYAHNHATVVGPRSPLVLEASILKAGKNAAINDCTLSDLRKRIPGTVCRLNADSWAALKGFEEMAFNPTTSASPTEPREPTLDAYAQHAFVATSISGSQIPDFDRQEIEREDPNGVKVERCIKRLPDYALFIVILPRKVAKYANQQRMYPYFPTVEAVPHILTNEAPPPAATTEDDSGEKVKLLTNGEEEAETAGMNPADEDDERDAIEVVRMEEHLAEEFARTDEEVAADVETKSKARGGTPKASSDSGSGASGEEDDAAEPLPTQSPVGKKRSSAQSGGPNKKRMRR